MNRRVLAGDVVCSALSSDK